MPRLSGRTRRMIDYDRQKDGGGSARLAGADLVAERLSDARATYPLVPTGPQSLLFLTPV